MTTVNQQAKNTNQKPPMIRQLKYHLKNSTYDIIITDRMRGCGRGRAPHLYGMILPDENTILIKKSISLEERTKTLVHELIHAVQPGWIEEIVESVTMSLYKKMTERDRGYFMFFVQDEMEELDQLYFTET